MFDFEHTNLILIEMYLLKWTLDGEWKQSRLTHHRFDKICTKMLTFAKNLNKSECKGLSQKNKIWRFTRTEQRPKAVLLLRFMKNYCIQRLDQYFSINKKMWKLKSIRKFVIHFVSWVIIVMSMIKAIKI